MDPAVTVPSRAWRDGFRDATRALPEETPVAVTYNRVTHAVMMATPADLEDFALGFSLSETIVERPDEIEEIEVVAAEGGLELRMWIAPARMEALERRRRRLAGATGCGLCGLESLEEATRGVPRVPAGIVVEAAALREAVAGLSAGQVLNRATHAVHAAGFWLPGEGMIAVREDVGRHNALDKLSGALARRGVAAAQGVVVLTSRVSIEMVQKAARMGAPILAAVSAPTAYALREAERAGMTLVGVARADGFEVFCGAGRVG
jgi:FdhD protein